jgi:hypothetical protein
MPQITAWRYSPSDPVFTEKSEYFKYLRQQGARRLASREVARSWSALQKSARSTEDICEWFEKYGSALLHTAAVLEDLDRSPSTRIYKSREIDSKATIRRARRVFEDPFVSIQDHMLGFDCDFTLPKTYSKRLNRALNMLDGVYTVRFHELGTPPCSFRAELHLRIGQWPWAVPRLLHKVIQEDAQGGASLLHPKLSAEVRDVLAKFYPDLSIDTLIRHIPVIKLLDSLESFTHWLDQFKTGHTTERAMDLPEISSGMSLG